MKIECNNNVMLCLSLHQQNPGKIVHKVENIVDLKLGGGRSNPSSSCWMDQIYNQVYNDV